MVKTFEKFVNENQGASKEDEVINEAASDWVGTIKNNNSDRIEVWIKGLKKAIKNAMGKEAIEYDGLDQVYEKDIYDLISKAFYKTNFKPKELNDLSPKKITIQF